MPLTFQQFQELRRKGLSPEQIASFEAGNKPIGATAFPQEQPEQQKKGFFSKVASLTKGIGGALISSEKGVGESLAAGPAASLPIVRQAQESQTLADAGAVDILKAIRTNRELGRDTSRLEATYRDVTGQPAFDFNEIIPAAEKTNKQALGEVAGVGLDVVTAGTLSKGAQSFKVLKAAQPVAKASKALTTGAKLAQTAKSTAKAAAVGAGIGYGYDVVNSLQENESGGDIYKPGWGAALGAVLPAAFGAYKAGKISGNALGGRIDNSLIKPLAKDFRYGKNPGKTMAEMGIVANSQDELIANLRKARQSVGAELGQTAQNLSETLSQKKPVSINLTKALSPLDDAIEAAAKTNDQNLLNRVQQVKRALTERLTTGLDEAGNTIIQSQGKRPLIGGFDNALEFKRLVGEVTKWTGNPSDDKLINKALKQVYGNIDDVMMKQARKADPTLASQFEKLNGRYGDLITAEIATKHTAELTQRQNLISLPIKVGTATGVITAIATGGASIPAVLAGVGAGVLEKALGSTAVKTRVAAWLSKESPTVLEKLVRNNPKVRDVLYKTFIKENDIVDRKVLERLKKIKVEGVPVGLSVKNVSPKALGGKTATTELFEKAKKYPTAEEFVKAQINVYHGGTADIKAVALGKSNFQKTFYVSDKADYAKSFGGNKSVVNEMALDPKAKLADMRKPSEELVSQIDQMTQGRTTGKTQNITKPDGTTLGVPEVVDRPDFGSFSQKQVIQGIRDGKAHFAELPEIKKALQKLGYDGQITAEVPYAKNIGVWNKEVIKTKPQLIDIWKKAHKK